MLTSPDGFHLVDFVFFPHAFLKLLFRAFPPHPLSIHDQNSH